MDATEVFSKITYLEAGMKVLLTQKAVSSEEIQQLLAAVEAKEKPTINLNADNLAAYLAPKLAAKIPALNATAVAKQLGPLLMEELPTPDSLRQAGDEAAAKLNQEFSRQEQRMQACVERLGGWMTIIEQRVKKLLDGIPHVVGLEAFRDPKVFLAVFGINLVVMLALMFHSLFMRVPKEEYERVVMENTTMNDSSAFYYNQIKAYQQKFPKTVTYFPEYHSAPQSKRNK